MANQPIEIDINITGAKDANRTIDDIKASVEELNAVLRALSTDKGYKGSELEQILKQQLQAEQDLLGVKLRQVGAINDAARASETTKQQYQRTAKDEIAAQDAIQRAYALTNQKVRLIQDSSEELNRSLSFIGRGKYIQELARQFALLADQTGNEEQAVQELQIALEKIGATQAEFTSASKAFSTARIVQQETLGGTRRFLTGGSVFLNRVGLSQLGTPLGSVADIVELYKDLPKVKAVLSDIGLQFGALVKQGLPVGIVLAGLAIAFKGLQEQLKGIDVLLIAATERNKLYYQTIYSDSTSTQILDKQKQLNQQLLAAQAHYDDMRNAQANAFASAQAQYGDAGARALLAVGQLYVPFANDAKKAEQEIANLKGQVAALGDAAKAVQLNDLIKSFSDNIDFQIAVQTEIANLKKGSTTDAIKRVDELSQQINIIQNTMNSTPVTSATTGKLNDLQNQLSDLIRLRNAIIGALNDVTRSETLRNKQSQADTVLKRAKEVQQEALDARVHWMNDMVGIADETRKAMKDINAKYDTKIADATEKDNNNALKALQDYNDQVAKVNQDAQEKSKKAEEDYQKKLLEIQNQFTQDSIDAVQSRDAVAYDAAKRKRDEALQQAEADKKDAQKARDEDNAKQLADLKQNFDKQRTERINQYRQQLADLQRQRQDELNALQQKRYDEENTRRQAYAQEIYALRQHLLDRQGVELGYWGASLAYVTSIKRQIDAVLGFGSSLSAGGGVSGAYTSAQKYVPTAFDTGGIVTRTGMALVHKDEVVLNRSQQAKYMGGITFSPVITGLSRGQVRQELMRQMDKFLDEVEASS